MSISAEQSLHEGKLGNALEALQTRVRNNPADPKDRIFLFQLLSVMGQWERAKAQLKVANELDPETLSLTQIYARAIEAEQFRSRVFRGDVTPEIIGQPDEWMAWLVHSLQLSAEGRFSDATELSSQAFDRAPSCSGTLNGEPFEWIADADSRLGPCLELIIEGKYCWTPMINLRSLQLEQPTDLRDVVWAPCAVTWTNGGQVPALIPTRYPGTETSENDLERLARRTEWRALAQDTHAGSGQRLFITNAAEYALLDVREIRFDSGTGLLLDETERRTGTPPGGDGQD